MSCYYYDTALHDGIKVILALTSGNTVFQLMLYCVAGIAMNTMGAQNQSNGPAVTASQNGHATRLQASNRTAGMILDL